MKYLLVIGLLGIVGCGGTVDGAGGAGGTTSSSSSSSSSGVSSSSSSSGTTSSSSSSSSSSGTTSSSSSSSSSSGGACTAASCMDPFICCGDVCVNPGNDILNCGECGKQCLGGSPYCDNGTCGKPPCTTPQQCGPAGTCCGDTCCKPGEICCDVPGPVSSGPKCQLPNPETMTCDKGCVGCVCASPDTPIATPLGDRPIADLRPGDLVYTVDHEAVVAAPIVKVNRAPVNGHSVVRVALASGAVLSISAPHPTADGRTFGDLRAGDTLDGITIVSVACVPYAHPFTHDVLPASSTGAYYAGGALIGSTLQP